MFGKCEICFRAGYCTISECKEQELKELEVINRIVNAASITAKVDQNLLKNLPDIKKVTPRDIPRVRRMNRRLTIRVIRVLFRSMKKRNTENLILKIQSLVRSLFTDPFQANHGGLRQILLVSKAISAADVTYWNQKTSNEVVKSNQKNQELVKKLDANIKKFNEIKQIAKKNQIADVNKIAVKNKVHLNQIIKKYNKVEKKLEKKEQAIKKILKSSTGKDPKVIAALGESLKKIQEYKKLVKSVKEDLKKRKKN